MFSRRLLTAARVAQLRRPMQQPLRGVPLPTMMNQVRTYADTLVKVPQMAESISEGTLKQWNKQIGDYVEADEEIATIETDKIDVAVNAPEAGVIKELMANEEDTVTVGQEIAKIEAGAAPEGGNKSESKEAPKEETASTDAKPAEPKEENKPEPSKPAPPPEPKKEKETPPP
ncbi:Bckgd2 [Apiospora aurea]|uniref:Bckgd2 n=1 Tax=Apiospora aurea TaxID=335848 RepID=A0ABR1PZR4_9PEZI